MSRPKPSWPAHFKKLGAKVSTAFRPPRHVNHTAKAGTPPVLQASYVSKGASAYAEKSTGSPTPVQTSAHIKQPDSINAMAIRQPSAKLEETPQAASPIKAPQTRPRQPMQSPTVSAEKHAERKAQRVPLSPKMILPQTCKTFSQEDFQSQVVVSHPTGTSESTQPMPVSQCLPRQAAHAKKKRKWKKEHCLLCGMPYTQNKKRLHLESPACFINRKVRVVTAYMGELTIPIENHIAMADGAPLWTGVLDSQGLPLLSASVGNHIIKVSRNCPWGIAGTI